ncbi:CsbD family protein [filamentous cyanobacterium LEGE 11480]|uniref:CsbD family protein n=1 Tax=Romeriopsis navalis LEGE 11480 TaxID=2777977 RepID=A0A928VR56_9CYAN|nr:CsbD family protein [Romeriopsis navalis LEGE 11480]
MASETQGHLGASVKDATGTVQEIVGRVTDNPALEAEGMARQTEAQLEHELASE